MLLNKNLVKVGVTAVVSILSLTTTVVAGYKAYKNNLSDVSADFEEPSPTPAVVEVVQEEFVTTTPEATTDSFVLQDNTIQSTNTPSPTFIDDFDDDVQFRDHDEDDKKDHEESQQKEDGHEEEDGL